MTSPLPPVAPRKLALATGGALGVALLVLLVAVLPAEYGLDPTGIGGALGLTQMREAPEPVAPDPAENTTGRTLYAWSGEWTLREEEIGHWTGRVEKSASQVTLRAPVQTMNLTKLVASLTWTDDVPASGPDTLEVSIRGESRQSELAQSATGIANATLALRPVPYPGEVNGSIMISAEADNAGQGNYTIVVRLYGTGATDSAPDAGNDWTLRLFAQTYAFEVTSEGAPMDRVTLSIPPGRGVEYKFAMEDGATMTYAWNASAPLYSDLHADHFEDEEDVLSEKIATLARDDGTYVAPFYGRHGWYWRNDGAEPVTVTLRTRGAYAIIGVPP